MRIPFALLLATSLSACAVGPEYVRPQVALTPAYATPAQVAAPDAQWWRRFDDPLLDRVVERVLAQNLDIAAAGARIAQARAVARGAGAALLPTGEVGASAETAKQSLNSPFGAAAHELGFPRSYDLYTAGAQASWEVDLFGGLTRQQQAARADAAGATADAAAVRLSVVAEAVDAYLQLRGLQARLAVAERQRDTEHALVGLIRQRVDQGVSAERELQRALGEEEGVSASLPPLRAAIAGQMNRLDMLMGAQAGTWRAELATAGAIPLGPDPSGSSNPAELMRRRPDVVAAERRLVAANARIGAAMAEYYPHLSLSGVLNVVSLGTSSLFTGNSVQASAGAGLRWRLFDFGRIDAEVAQSKGREAEALALYRSSILHATEDVENAFVRLGEGRTEVATLERQVAALRLARTQTQSAYESGVVALLDVLDADRALLEASDRLEQARAQQARASVAAIRALGGGYEEA
ncbi:efflux transporter outer membrane subunit [Novosphingobium sp. JCM 18896]|uniref:efflux transporter outer membrane subunit n=1 Tax=Novosphingobium sp. JCM 18896 TaxID=2989731 RepID=UPI00222177CA|nr:efflux transporter outer membrane subunit [Novosphingobium sp. JCM 18896]MCW1431242.1 efflux transporter outer membrane subunit [Novosphingobium sp. JCM 18896]